MNQNLLVQKTHHYRLRNNDNRLIRVTDDLINGVYSKDRDKFRSVYDNLLTYNDEFFVLKDFA